MMQTQTFQYADLGVVLFLVLLEALLSADNALILAMMVRHLEHADRKRALFYGLGGAFVFRFAAILMAKHVLALWWLKGLGAAYLLYVPGKHFFSKRPQSETPASKKGFWPTVISVELSDMAFAVDSVLAGVGVIRSSSKIWVVFTGAAIGMVLLRFAANLFIKLLARYPIFDDVAYLLVGWVGMKLGFAFCHSAGQIFPDSILGTAREMTDTVFWTGMILIAVAGTVVALRRTTPKVKPVLLPMDDEE